LDFLSIKETAKILKVSYHTVYRLIAEGKLGAHKVRGCWRISDSELNQFLQKSHSLYIETEPPRQKRYRLKIIKRNY